jgi:hypothetical protein
MQENKSEIARLRQQIALEEEAAYRGFYGYATVARHDFIEARMTWGADRILKCIEEGKFEEAEALMELPDWGAEQTE